MAGRRNQKSRPTLAIVGDGHTEKLYFEDFKNKHRDINLAIKPELPDNSGPLVTLNKAIKLHEEGYDKVFALVDMDVIIKNNQTTQEYNNLKKKAETLGIIVLENNPCFEMWILCHFIKTGKLFNSCADAIKEIKKDGLIPDYSKKQEYLKKAKLYSSYKHLIRETAIPYAKFLEKGRGDQDKKYPRAQTYILMEKLLDLVN